MTKRIDLSNLSMNHFTVFDAELYCQILKINLDNVFALNLNSNNLTDISGVNIFKNLKILWLNDNKITDLDSLNNLINLEFLYLHDTLVTDLNSIKNFDKLQVLSINNLNFTKELETVEILKNLTNLTGIYCSPNTFKTVNIRKKFKDLEIYD